MSYTYAFEKLTVWQMNRQFAKKLYLKTKSFPKEEFFGITSQIRRACISVSCNLAEGSARKTPKEQLRFYEIAFASGAEVVNLLILCNDLELLSAPDNSLSSRFVLVRVVAREERQPIASRYAAACRL